MKIKTRGETLDISTKDVVAVIVVLLGFLGIHTQIPGAKPGTCVPCATPTVCCSTPTPTPSK